MMKTEVVAQWWEQRLAGSKQLSKADLERNPLCRPMSQRFPWKQRIATDRLWEDFQYWRASQEFYPVPEEIGKIGFMTIFYRVSGAEMSTMRHGGSRIKVAKFRTLTWHREYLKVLNAKSSDRRYAIIELTHKQNQAKKRKKK